MAEREDDFMSTETNASTNVSAALSAQSFTGKILAPADFTALDGLIQTLGSRSAVLSPDEKAGAVAVVDEWTTSVVSRIQNNASQADIVIRFLEGQSLYGSSLYDTIELFREAMGDTPEYLACREAMEKYSEIQADRPIEVPVEGGMTVEQADRVGMDNYAANLEHARKLKSAEYAFNKSVKAYMKSLAAIPEIKALKGSLVSYRNKASRMAAQCQDKATRAKLNITVSDPETRKTLHDMLDFAKTV